MKSAILAISFGMLVCAAAGSAQASTFDVNSPFVFTGITKPIGIVWSGGGGGGSWAAFNIVQNTAGTAGSPADYGAQGTLGDPASSVANGQSITITPDLSLTLGGLGATNPLGPASPGSQSMSGGGQSNLGNQVPIVNPEPASLLLVATGLAGLAMAAWRRKR